MYEFIFYYGDCRSYSIEARNEERAIRTFRRLFPEVETFEVECMNLVD